MKPSAARPLPHIKDDPAVHSARTTRQAYTDAVAAIRADSNRTPIDAARAINRAWRTAVADLTGQHNDLTARRQARLGYLDERLPIRPVISSDTPAAERAALLAEWRDALDAARQADADERAAMLADAERYGDDTRRRAVLAAAVDDSQWSTVDTWAKAHDPEAGERFTEWRQLGELAAGRSFENTWEWQAFRGLDRPQESRDLPAMVNAYNREVHDYNASRAATQRPRDPITLTPEETGPSTASTPPAAA